MSFEQNYGTYFKPFENEENNEIIELTNEDVLNEKINEHLELEQAEKEKLKETYKKLWGNNK